MNTAEIQLVQEFDMAVHVGGVSLAVSVFPKPGGSSFLVFRMVLKIILQLLFPSQFLFPIRKDKFFFVNYLPTRQYM